MQPFQTTVGEPVHCFGVGMHSGKKVRLSILPSPPNHGIRFARTDLPNRPVIPAHFRHVVDTSLATVLGKDGVIVSTIEHLMATFAGLGVDNALVEIDSYELPIMDGSAWPFTEMLLRAQILNQPTPRSYFLVKKPIELSENGRSVALYPADAYNISCTIDFNHPLLRDQSYSVKLTGEVFEKEISPARTFGFLEELDYLKRYGFAKGGSLENAVVIDHESVINTEGLRFENEFVRHKLLDCIGDFSLLGIPIIGHIVTNKSGHSFNHAFLQMFFDRKDAWETATGPQISRPVS